MHGHVSPGLEALTQWISEGSRQPGSAHPSSSRAQKWKCPHSSAKSLRPSQSVHVDDTAYSLGSQPDALEALVSATAIKSAVRLQPLGYRPGVTSGRVGLLQGLRTPDMDKYDETVKPPKRRAPPSDLSGLSAQEIVARRNRLAREYGIKVQERREAAVKMLEADAAALRVAQEVMENAPPGIAYLTLSGDMRGLVLYANGSMRGLLLGLGMAAAAAPREADALLGRPFADFVHPDDRAAFHDRLAVLVLSKNPHFGSSLRFRIVCPDGGFGAGEPQWVENRFRFGAFGVACSIKVM